MSEILRGENSHLEGTWDKRGIIPKTRMLLTALAASTMLMGGPQASAQTQTTEDGKARIEMREKQENIIIPLIGNQGVREYFYANNSELPMLPQSAELKWSEIYPQIKDGKWDITEHPASYFFMSNNNSSTFTLDGLGEIYSIRGDYREKISDSPYKVRIWGPTAIHMTVDGKEYDIVVNQVGNLCVEEPNTQGSTVPEVRELKAKEEIYMLKHSAEIALPSNVLEEKLGKKILSSDTKITIP